jgi:hypothetical protein
MTIGLGGAGFGALQLCDVSWEELQWFLALLSTAVATE